MPHECTTCGRTFADGSKEMLSGCPDCGGKKFQFRPAGSDAPAEGDDDSSSAAASDAPDADSAPADTGGDTNAGGNTNADAGSLETRAWPGETDDSTPESDAPDTPDASDAPDAPTADSSSVESSPGDATGSGAAGSGAPSAVAAEDADAADAATAEADASAGSPDADDVPSPTAGEAPGAADDEAADVAATEDTAQASARSDVVSPDEIRDATDETESGSPPAGSTEAGEAEPDIEALREELNQQFESIRILNPGQYELNLMELYDRDEYIISLREDGRYVIEMPEGWGPRDGE